MGYYYKKIFPGFQVTYLHDFENCVKCKAALQSNIQIGRPRKLFITRKDVSTNNVNSNGRKILLRTKLIGDPELQFSKTYNPLNRIRKIVIKKRSLSNGYFKPINKIVIQKKYVKNVHSEPAKTLPYDYRRRECKLEDFQEFQPVKDDQKYKPLENYQEFKLPKNSQEWKHVKTFQGCKPVETFKGCKSVNNLKEYKPVKNFKECKTVKNLKECKSAKNLKASKSIKKLKPIKNVKESKSVKKLKGKKPVKKIKEKKPVKKLKESKSLKKVKNCKPVKKLKECKTVKNCKESKPSKSLKECKPDKNSSKPAKDKTTVINNVRSNSAKKTSSKSGENLKDTKVPGKGTLKRKRWFLNKLKLTNDDYEDDLFENQKFGHFQTLFEDETDSSEKYDDLKTPVFPFTMSPRETTPSPTYKDCYSPTQLSIFRKDAEEYQYRRRKRLKALIPESKGDVLQVNQQNREEDVKKRLEEVARILSAHRKENEKASDSEDDQYFSDILDSCTVEP